MDAATELKAITKDKEKIELALEANKRDLEKVETRLKAKEKEVIKAEGELSVIQREATALHTDNARLTTELSKAAQKYAEISRQVDVEKTKELEAKALEEKNKK